MDMNELKFRLKMMGCTAYRSNLRNKAFADWHSKGKISHNLAPSRGD
jgi:hypothetical protein